MMSCIGLDCLLLSYWSMDAAPCVSTLLRWRMLRVWDISKENMQPCISDVMRLLFLERGSAVHGRNCVPAQVPAAAGSQATMGSCMMHCTLQSITA
jgi:hypothetical protein